LASRSGKIATSYPEFRGIPGTHTSFPHHMALVCLEMRYVSPDLRACPLALAQAAEYEKVLLLLTGCN
jgi:hypothetical protein